MSYTTITQATEDVALQDRVMAAGMKEAISGGPEFVLSDFGVQLRQVPHLALNYFLWPSAVQYETEYEYALNSENPNPGGDPTVITDANLQAVVQAWWPRQEVAVPQPPIFPVNEVT